MSGRDDVAGGLADLVALLEEEEEDWEVSPGSVLTFAQMFADQEELPTPVIGIAPSGNVQAEWAICTRGLLVMDFQGDDRIHFVAFSAPATAGSKRRRLQGTLPRKEVMRQVQAAFEWQ